MRARLIAAFLLGMLTAADAAAQARIPLAGHVPNRVQRATRVGRVSPGELIELSLVVHVDDALMNEALTRMYGRNAPVNRRFLSSVEFAQQFGLAEKRAALKQYAESAGLTVKASEDRADSMVVKVTGTAAAIEQAFSIQLNEYRDAAGERFRAHQTDPLVPVSIREHLTAILGLSNITGVFHPNISVPIASNQLQSAALAGTAPGGGLSPNDFETIYSISPSSPTGGGQTVAVFELAQFNPADFATYTSQFNLPNIPLTVIPIDGFVNACNPSGCGFGATEVNLDIQLIAGGAPGVAGILVYDGPNSAQGALDTYNQIAMDNQAQVISTSWGQGEPEMAASFVQAENQIFQRMALQGQSMYAASGDGGSYAGGNGASVQDPAAQPYVTAVGGTSLSGTIQAPIETAWIGSGGGISGVWPLPAYQVGLTGAASQQFRNVPDVALNADLGSAYGIVNNGNWTKLAGTSAAAPLWAALTARINQQRIASGIPVLGFANATLYELAASSQYSNLYRDITSGNNGVYSAGPGYDNVTGWGSYRGTALLNAAAQIDTFVSIYSPVAGQFLSSQVTISGSAASPAFSSYLVEYGAGSQPSAFSQIGVVHTTPVPFGLLETWNTSGLPTGTYALRLTMTESSGQTISSVTTPLYIDLIPPSAPAQVTLVPQSTTSLSLSWTTSTDNFGVAGYKIDVSTFPSFFTYVKGYQNLDWPASSPPGFLVSSLTPGTTYYARVRAYDAAGNVSPNSPVAQGTTTPLPPPPPVVSTIANYDSNLMAPACHTTGSVCDSGSLLNGRFNLSGGSEPNSSNTLFNSCPDGSSGTYHVDESNDRLQVSSLDGQPFAAGKTVRITATVWAYSNFNVDFLDLYSAPNANSPVWTLIGSVQPAAVGAQVLSLIYTLPNGSLQAIRANFRFSGRASACTVGGYNDHDDLVFAVGSTASTPPPAPVITSVANASGNVGSNFSYSITASNSPGSFNATGLPTGLSVNMTTGLISGIPGVTGTFPVNLSATNASGTGTAVLSLTINPALPAAPVITSPSAAIGSVGSGFSYSITATNNPTSYAAGGLPSWLSINPTSGLISGVPTSAGTFTLTLTATNAAGSGTGNFSLTISPPAPPQAPVALMTVTPQSGAGPLTVTCNASASTGGNLTYAWNFGDHSIAFGRVVTHTYSTPGLYGITLSISNSLGTANVRTTISVSGP